jgi:hypothetical protein
MPLYLVDTIVTYRMKYVVEAKELSHAYDEVSMNDGNLSELTQKCLGEHIIDGRQVTIEEVNQLLAQYKNDQYELSSHWMGEKLINKIKYED